MTETKEPKTGELQVWWVPQIPMDAFYVPVDSIEEGVKICNVLADYDLFQYEKKVKPDYCNTGGLRCYLYDGWIDFGYNDELDLEDLREELESRNLLNTQKDGD